VNPCSPQSEQLLADAPGRLEDHEDLAPIVGVALPAHKPGAFQAVDQLGGGGRRQAERRRQSPHRDRLVGRGIERPQRGKLRRAETKL